MLIRIAECQLRIPPELFPSEAQADPGAWGRGPWLTVKVQSRLLTGEDLRAALLALFRSATSSEAEQLWWGFENVVFSQDTVNGPRKRP